MPNGKNGSTEKRRLGVPDLEMQLQQLQAELAQAHRTIATQALALARLSALLTPEDEDGALPTTSYLNQRHG